MKLKIPAAGSTEISSWLKIRQLEMLRDLTGEGFQQYFCGNDVILHFFDATFTTDAVRGNEKQRSKLIKEVRGEKGSMVGSFGNS